VGKLNPNPDSIVDYFYFEMHSRALRKAILSHNENLMFGKSE